MPILPAAFRLASRLRGARTFHPRGEVFTGTWEPATPAGPLTGSPLFAQDHRVLLRLSRGIGLPDALPDILGWAVKVLDAHGPGHDQDLLLASTGSGRLGRHLLRPARDLAAVTYSSLLPYEVADAGRCPVVARAVPGAGPAPAAELGALNAAELPRFVVRLRDLDGPLLATVRVDGVAPARTERDSRFDPWHTGPELRPVGWLNRVRAPTYTASQDGRGAPADGIR